MTATITAAPEPNRDGTITWLAFGVAGGIPYVAEGATEDQARAAACALIYQRHTARHRHEASPCSA